jgi:hypothetical protein
MLTALACCTTYSAQVQGPNSPDRAVPITYRSPEAGVDIITAALKRSDFSAAYIHAQVLIQRWPTAPSAGFAISTIVLCLLHRMELGEPYTIVRVVNNQAIVRQAQLCCISWSWSFL